jgi:hypothetical protein
VFSWRIGLLIKLPKDDVDRENFEGLSTLLAAFFLRKIKATTAAPMRRTAPAAAPPAMAATGGPPLEPLASAEAPLVVLGFSVALAVSGAVVVVFATPFVALVVGLAVLVGFGFAVVCLGAVFWFWSLTHSLLEHEYPNGQHMVPQRSKVPPRAVVLTTASGFFSPSCSEISHGSGLIFWQSAPSGQQRTVVLAARGMQN